MGIDWNRALLYGQLVRVAERVPAHADYSDEQKNELKQLGYNYLETIYGSDLATDIDPHLGDTVQFGFVAVQAIPVHAELVVALRGTDTILEWLHDAEFLMVPSTVSGGLTEDGFTALYKSLHLRKAQLQAATVTPAQYVRSLLNTLAPSNLTICGHSLGGALATLLSRDLAIAYSSTYTFASPRVGDHIFAHEYAQGKRNSYRIENRLDLVPKLPPVLPLPYEHVGEKLELIPKGVEFSIPCEHHLSTYLHLIGLQIGDGMQEHVFPLDADCVE